MFKIRRSLFYKREATLFIIYIVFIMHCLIFNIEERSHTRSLGPYRIAHWLRELGWDVEVIDYCAHWSIEELMQLCLIKINSKTKFVGFSSLFTGWNNHQETFSKNIKKFYPNVFQIYGSSCLPNRIMSSIDYYVYGFGERVIYLLLKYLFSNGGEGFYIQNAAGDKLFYGVFGGSGISVVSGDKIEFADASITVTLD